MTYTDIDIEYNETSGGFTIIGSGGGKKRGGGGKGGGGSAKSTQPTEAKVSLQSSAIVRGIAVIGEGEIEGFVSDPLKCIYFDDTPIQNLDGSINFKDFYIDYRFGTQHQDYIPLVPDVESEIGVNVKVTKSGGAVSRTINAAEADTVKVRLMTPLLRRVDKDNNIVGNAVRFQIQLSTDGGPFVTRIEDDFNGYTTGAYERTYTMNVHGSSWTVRVIKVTPDSTSTTDSSDLYWQSYTTIINTKFRYPNTALIAFEVPAEQFQSIPRLSVHIRGLKIAVPYNYDPIARTYNGPFNGSLVVRYSNNPAWILWDLLTNDRYGVGTHFPSSLIDRYSFDAMGRYCDELVPNGFGGWEPRFVANVYISTQDDAWKVLEAMASVFRGMLYFGSGMITAIQDRPRGIIRAYSEANVVCEYGDDGVVTAPPFVYSGVAKSAIHTVAYVSYQSKEAGYKVETEYVENVESRRRYGFNPIEITAFACTTRSQAHRAGEWLLASESLRTESVVFKVASDGLLVRPGEVFAIMDTNRAGQRRAGRIVASTSNSITIDDPVAITQGTLLYAVDINGNLFTRGLTNTDGAHTVLTWADYVEPLPMNHPWMVDSALLRPALFQCSKVSEISVNLYEITATTYGPDVYDYVDFDRPIQPRLISQLPDPRKSPASPGYFTVEETLVDSLTGGVRSRLDVSWAPSRDPFVERYRLSWRIFSDPSYHTLTETSDTRYVWYDAPVANLEFRVTAINTLGVESQPQYTSYAVRGLVKAPAYITGIGLNPLGSGNECQIVWDLHPDLDVRMSGRIKIKHTSRTGLVYWRDGMDLIEVSGNSTSAIVPFVAGTYMLKAIDTSGQQTQEPTRITVGNVPELIKMNVVEVIQEHPAFSGVGNNVTINTGSVKLSSTDYIDLQAGNWDDYVGLVDEAANYFDSEPGNFNDAPNLFDSRGTAYGMSPSGFYNFSRGIDLGQVYTVRISSYFEALKVNEYALFDGNAGDIDSTIGDFDSNDNVDSSNAELQISISQDGTTYGDWQRFLIGDYAGRAFKFRVHLYTGESFHNVIVNKLSVEIDMPDRMDTGTDLSVTVPTMVNFEHPFYAAPTISAIIQNPAVGDRLEIYSSNTDNFTYRVLANDGTILAGRTISWYAKGYGKTI